MMKPKKKYYVKNTLLFISILTIIVYFLHIESMYVSTGGIFKVNNKFSERNNYYIELNDKKIKCSRNEYNLIEQGKVYMVDYTWNENWPQKCKLDYIELTDIEFD